jgi:hypothetical protein
LSPRRYGPFSVAAQISHVAYRLDLPPSWKIHNVFHVSLLTPYKETPQHGPNFLQPPPDIINDTPEWEVEQILGSRTFGRWKKKQYRIRWKGYSPAHDSWENADDVHAPELADEFYATNPLAIRTLELCQEASMGLFPSTTFTPPHIAAAIPGTFDDEDDEEPMSPEDYDETPATSPINRITRYDNDPYGSWGPTSAFWPQPATPLSDIEPSTDPWPYPLE